MICIKIHTKGTERLLAACDADIVGKTFSSGKLRIEVAGSFYKEDVVEDEVLLNWLRLATIANLVGERTVGIAVDNGFVDKDNIIMIGCVPHAQMARMI